MDFSEALELIKEGKKLERESWNVKGMFVFLVKKSRIRLSFGLYEAHIAIKTSGDDSKIIPWTMPQTDVLADDWTITPFETINLN